jgi:hypothetical protein
MISPTGQAMAKTDHTRDGGRPDRFKEYGLGLGLGGACALYGLVALWLGHTYLPGLKGGNHTVAGKDGAVLAAAFIAGGLYLIARLFVHRRCHSEGRRAQVYLVEVVLLGGLIASLVYVLWQVGTVG